MAQTLARPGFLDFSPPLNPPSRTTDDKTNKENDVPVLSLIEFSRSPFVCFGTIKLGSSKSLPLRIENSTEDATTTVIVDKIPSSKGFSVNQTSFTIQVSIVIVTVTWTPVEDGGFRELLSFVANGIVKHQAILLGKAEAPKKKKFMALKCATLVIQKQYRAFTAARMLQCEFLAMRKAAVTIQSAYRGMRARQEMFKRAKAATLIQSALRAFTCRKKFLAQKSAAIVLQQIYRARALRQLQRDHYLQLRQAAIGLQAIYRGSRARRAQTTRHRAATVIQTYFRVYRVRVSYLAVRCATVVIQRRYRAHVLEKHTRASYIQTKTAAVTIQSAFRGMQVRRKLQKMHLAATVIQAHFRGHSQLLKYKRQKWAASVIQQHFQASVMKNAAEKQYVALKTAALFIQSVYRGMRARKRLAEMHWAARALQSTYRARKQCREYRALKQAAVVVQRKFRAKLHAEQQRDMYSSMRRAAITLQAACRGMRVRQEMREGHRAATVIQARYRMYRRYRQLKDAAVCLQKSFRGRKGREAANRLRAARTIQSYLRVALQRRRFLKTKAAVVAIQSAHRGRRCRVRLAEKQKAALVIQRWYRSRRLVRTRLAAIKVQSALRMHIYRRRYVELRACAVVLQAHYRMWAARRSFLCHRAKEAARVVGLRRFCAAAYHHLCAVRIQRALRAHWALTAAQRQISSILYIQRWIRAKLQRKRYLEQRESIIKVQRVVKAWFHHRSRAATVIQHMARRFLLRCRKEKLQQGIIKAQALWRGHSSRKFHDTSKVISIRHRLRKVNREAKEEDKLCHKTKTALSYLLEYHNYAHILMALKNLETATRLSPECCEHLVNSGATRTVFTLIRSCNRSVPSMEIITLAIQVLLNLSKYNKTIDTVYEVEDSVDTLLDLLQIYREKAGDKVADKGGSIFTKACFLLVILVQDEGRAMVGISRMSASDRICSIYRLTMRKYKMDAQRTKVKQKMNVSLNGSFLPQATPQKSKFVPDWVLQKAKRKDIVDPLGAIQMLVHALALIP
uniref:Abnormal spindle-like microcephaly-associated protein ASH domain-containing protein n=1 Tax=Electrophorus electricus TaxID=8005 RepID=A0A4W4EZS8_ELEEL